MSGVGETYICKKKQLKDCRLCTQASSNTPVLPKSRHTLKIMVSGLFVEFEIKVNHIHDIILNTVTMRT